MDHSESRNFDLPSRLISSAVVREPSEVSSAASLAPSFSALRVESVRRCSSGDEHCALASLGPSSCAPFSSTLPFGSGTTPESKSDRAKLIYLSKFNSS